MRQCRDREGHVGLTTGTESGCILGLCRGESQAKICKHAEARCPKISILRILWTFASGCQPSQILRAVRRPKRAEIEGRRVRQGDIEGIEFCKGLNAVTSGSCNRRGCRRMAGRSA